MADSKHLNTLTLENITSAGISEREARPLLNAILQCQATAGKTPQQVGSLQFPYCYRC